MKNILANCEILVFEEERVVRERTHRDADLRQVEEVLQERRLPEQQSVRDVLCEQEAGDQVLSAAGLPAVRTQREGAHPPQSTEAVQHDQVRVHVVEVVVVGRVLRVSVEVGGRYLLVRPST